MKLNIGVIFGGESVEHEISIISAQQVLHALNHDKYNVIPLYLAKDHTLYSGNALFDLNEYKDMDQLKGKLSAYALANNLGVINMIPLKQKWFSKYQIIDLVLPIMHGTYGEDGTIQGYLDILKVPYCGSRVLGASISQDKVIMKQILSFYDLPMVPWKFVQEMHMDKEHIYAEVESLSYPVIVKPANLGSSIGIRVVKQRSMLIDDILEAMKYDSKVLIESYVEDLREFNCSVFRANEVMKTSEIEEVIKQDSILSFQDKYEGQSKSKGMLSTTRKLPADISLELKLEIETLSMKTCDALQAYGVVRIDFIFDAKHNKLYVNEINSIPGSLAFYLWEPKSMPFSGLLDELVDQAIEMQRIKEQHSFKYNTNILKNQTFVIKK